MPVTRLDRQRRAAARVAVELRHHDAVELGRLRELLGDVDRVLARHRVDHQQDVVRPEQLLEVGELLHQLLVDVQPAGGVDDQHVLAVTLRLVERPRGDLARVAVGALLVDGRAGLLPDLDELLDGRGPVDVAGRERHVLPCSFFSRRASLAQAVVLPDPWRPAIRITVGGVGANVTWREDSPISWVSSSFTILTTCWPGLRDSSTSCRGSAPSASP